MSYDETDEEPNVCGLCGREITNPCERCAPLPQPRLPCGCPLDSGCSGHHTDGST